MRINNSEVTNMTNQTANNSYSARTLSKDVAVLQQLPVQVIAPGTALESSEESGLIYKYIWTNSITQL